VESDSPLASLPASGLSEPPPTRQPVWKQELNRKLEGYRDRQKTGQDQGTVVGTVETAVSEHSESRPSAQAAAAGANTAAGAAPAAATRTASGVSARTKVESNWRRVAQQPSPAPSTAPSAAAAQKLPPLPKTSNGSTEAGPATPVEPAAGTAQPLRSSEVAATAPIAPIAVRAVAGVLDFAVIVVALGVFLAVFYLMGGVTLTDLEGLRSIAIAFLGIVCFYWIFYVGYLGGTSGMNWLGLRVLNFDGQPPSGAQRRARALGTILSTMSLGLGFAWSIADEEKLTWHDRMSKTFVTRDGAVGFRARKAPSGSKRLPNLPNARRV
jgi:uncharacterized RDD family membrane protein YckC